MKTNTTECPICIGKGEALFSCCTGELLEMDTDICPKCHEHAGESTCQECKGTGEVSEERADQLEFPPPLVKLKINK